MQDALWCLGDDGGQDPASVYRGEVVAGEPAGLEGFGQQAWRWTAKPATSVTIKSIRLDSARLILVLKQTSYEDLISRSWKNRDRRNRRWSAQPDQRDAQCSPGRVSCSGLLEPPHRAPSGYGLKAQPAM